MLLLTVLAPPPPFMGYISWLKYMKRHTSDHYFNNTKSPIHLGGGANSQTPLKTPLFNTDLFTETHAVATVFPSSSSTTTASRHAGPSAPAAQRLINSWHSNHLAASCSQREAALAEWKNKCKLEQFMPGKQPWGKAKDANVRNALKPWWITRHKTKSCSSVIRSYELV